MIEPISLIELFVFALAHAWGYIYGAWGAVWTEAAQRKKVNYMVSKYGENWQKSADAKEDKYYYSALYGSRWIGHNVADCSGLFRWAFSKFGIEISHSSNRIWNSWCQAKGEMKNGRKENGEEIKPGTAVFVRKGDNRSHIGLYIGEGRVIEAYGTQKGVIESKVTERKWTEWGELKNVNYGSEPAPSGQKPTLRRGDKGPYVTLAQTELINKGYSCGSTGADGDFGKNTESAVKRFQNDHGLSVDGIIGEKTWYALDGAEPAIKYTVTVPGLTATQADALILQYPGSTKTEERG